ncbi:MAG: G1 family glutamic endopeptidase [Hyphomicrobiaceae bacterium]
MNYSSRIYAALELRFHKFAIPGDQLDLLSADGAVLAEYGIPPRPDQRLSPRLFAFWRKLVSRPFQFLVPEFPRAPEMEGLHPLAAHMIRPGHGLRPSFSVRGHRESSRNWSGAYITPYRPYRFNMMVGSWIVPAIEPPATLPEGACGGIFRSSAWIGIDGHRGRYPKASLPQIGTRHDIVPAEGPAPSYGAWIQWWKHNPDPVTDPENRPLPIMNFPVAPGDEIMAGLIVNISNDVQFFIKNQRTGHFAAAIVIAPGVVDPLGTTAEWIVERPTNPDTRKMDVLPNYGMVQFSDCLAVSGPTRSVFGSLQTLDGNARFITMRDMFANPHRSAAISIANKIDATTAGVRFSEPGRTV